MLEKNDLKIEYIEVVENDSDDYPVEGHEKNRKIIVGHGAEFEILIKKNLLKYIDKYDVAIALLGLKKINQTGKKQRRDSCKCR